MGSFVVRRLYQGDITGGFGGNNVASGAAAVAQKLRSRLYLNRGEWFLDPDAGTPWLPLPDLLDKPILGSMPADIGYAERTIKKIILETPDVTTITDFSLDFNSVTRKLQFSASGTTVDGDVWNIEVIR